jgi:hypothetical protein
MPSLNARTPLELEAIARQEARDALNPRTEEEEAEIIRQFTDFSNL